MKKLLPCFVVLVALSLCAAGCADGAWICASCGTANTAETCTNCGAAYDPGTVDDPGTVGIDVTINGKTYSGTYQGEMSGGVPNGEGSFISEDADMQYTGTWTDGSVSGTGTVEAKEFTIAFSYSKGEYEKTCYFKGSVKDGLPDGEGKSIAYTSDGKTEEVYEGNWKNGEYSGQGTKTRHDKNGKKREVFEGNWKDNEINGKGKKAFYDEKGKLTEMYEGYFSKGALAVDSLAVRTDGIRYFKWPDGERTLRFYAKNTNRKKVVSYEVKYYTKNSKGKKATKAVKVSVDEKLEPNIQYCSPLFYPEIKKSSRYLCFSITKVKYSNGKTVKPKSNLYTVRIN